MKEIWGKKIIQRIAAAFISFLMVMSLLPISMLQVKARMAEHTEFITVEVKDGNGNAIEGANVDYTISSNTNILSGDANGNNISAGATTDNYGIADIMASSQYLEDDLTISATISKSGYVTDMTTISSEAITSDTQNFVVLLTEEAANTLDIENITAIALDSIYSKGIPQKLITEISGTQEGDQKYYSTNGTDWDIEIPEQENAGEYPVYIKVTRDGCNDYISGEFIAKIHKADINADITAYEASYDNSEHAAFSISGLENGDKVTCTYGGNETEFTYAGEESIDIPMFKNVGEYTFTVKIERDSNYNNFEQQYVAKITAPDVDGISVVPNKGLVYNGEEQELIKEIEGIETGDIIYFSLDDGNIWKEWQDDKKPKAKDADTYVVLLKIARGGVEKELSPVTVIIEKAAQTIEFVEEHTETVVFLSDDESKNLYNFAAAGGQTETPKIKYKVENASKEDDVDVSEIADIVEDGDRADAGQLKLLKAGYNIKITATVEGDKNYKEESISYNLTILNNESNLILFLKDPVDYIIGTNGGVISSRSAELKYPDDNGQITYTGKIKESGMSCEDAGITVEGFTVKVSNIRDLSDAIELAKGELIVEITAHKAEGTKQSTWGSKTTVYDACEISYTICISTEKISDKAYTMQDSEGNEITVPNGKNGWYSTAVTIFPIDGYTIARDMEDSKFGDSVVFGEADQGQANREIYLRNTETGAITAPIVIAVDKLDNVKPNDLDIEFPETEEKDGIKYYNDKITLTFTATDVASGVDTFDWSYIHYKDAGSSIWKEYSGTLRAVRDPDETTKYTASLTLPIAEAEQLRGHLKVSATDIAGNTSDSLTDTGVFVVDTISPKQSVGYHLKEYGGTEQTIGTKHYFSGEVEFIFNIVEANFYAADVEITVAKNGSTAGKQTVAWAATKNLDEYEARLTLSEDGNYVVGMTYTDRSKNEMLSYVSETIVIDRTPPVIMFHYADDSDAVSPQTATITIKEKNFNKKDIEVLTSAETIEGKAVNVKDLQTYLRSCEWTSIGEDEYSATISDQFVDAIYRLTFDYKDLALNSAEQVVTDSFIVDHTAPSTDSMTVSYSNSLKDTILSAITFGFYNPTVTVTFTAYDKTSGIEYFTWDYTRQEDVSERNVEKYADTKLTPIQDATDKTKFTASVTLPKKEEEQLRGSIAFTATDRCANTSDKLADDNHVIIVDTISPTMTAEYTTPDNTFGGKAYYNKSITASFTITEANFYSKDVVVKLTKNDGTAKEIRPVWKNISADVHVGTYTIEAPDSHANDGDYVFTVEYTDRSSNKMKTYASKVLVMDTIAPVINVEYLNQNPVNVLIDSEGNSRKYFGNTQTAILTIKEHNFNANEVILSVVAKDVAGNELNADELYSKSSWTTNGDNHMITITYPGDANYTFDVAYTDLARVSSADYDIEYFTVDTTKPAGLTISYSASVLDTILSNISFGFYDAKMTVTVTATDYISGVNRFKYSYLNSEGVSAVNEQLADQQIEASGIKYSDDKATGSTSFEIPRTVLEANSQFHGTVNFTATDRSLNESDYLRDTKRVIVDNIAPTADVQYSTPVQIINNVSYYAGDVNTTITINEANFYSEDVDVSVTRDGEIYAVIPSWNDNGTDIHIGTFTLSGDGDYFVDISYADKSSNAMQQYTSEQITIDTDIAEAVITVNGEEADGKAFKNEVVPEIRFEDTNFESYEIKLTRTSYADKNVDVTEKFIAGHVTTNATGGSGRFDTFDKLAENDGIYTMTVSLADKAGHTIEKAATFTVNRFGSVYEYSDYLVSLIENGGAYVQEIRDDLIITEYNADRLLGQSLSIEISKDGKPLDDSIYDVTPEINDMTAIGSSGWYQYQYTISKNNFRSDGVYKISVSSKDATGNSPENTNYENKVILFRVDSTSPEIVSITGLEEGVINATSAEVGYTVYDTIGLESIVIYVDAKEVENITDFTADMNNYSGSLTLLESASSQAVRFVATDLAGNVIDTDADGFDSAYAFHGLVTVSTNIFVRWFADKMLFFGSIGAAAAVIGSVIIIVVLVKRKRRREAE